ncbi:MAG: hypothetical protein KKF93_03425 [Candidatus Omnitrophica bacterium]|nr:hypothetical protein [Candidatus Omnitrophota bacterium]
MMGMGVLGVMAWGVAFVLGVMWLFLPWIIIAKLNQIVEELKKLNAGKNT